MDVSLGSVAFCFHQHHSQVQLQKAHRFSLPDELSEDFFLLNAKLNPELMDTHFTPLSATTCNLLHPFDSFASLSNCDAADEYQLAITDTSAIAQWPRIPFSADASGLRKNLNVVSADCFFLCSCLKTEEQVPACFLCDSVLVTILCVVEKGLCQVVVGWASVSLNVVLVSLCSLPQEVFAADLSATSLGPTASSPFWSFVQSVREAC